MFNLRFNENCRKTRQFVAAMAFLLFAAITTAQAQTTTFGQFFQRSSNAQNFVFTNNFNNSTSSTFTTISGGNPVYFQYGGIMGLPMGSELQGLQFATVIVTASTTAAATGNVDQPFNQTFTIEIIRDTAASTGGGTRRNLLTATVAQATSLAQISGSGGSGNFNASDLGTAAPMRGQIVTFTSDFLDFTQTTARNFSIALSSINPTLTIGAGGIADSFAASGTGTFASNPPPVYVPPTASSVNIGGRILTADGRGVSRALIYLTDSNGMTRTVISNSFGYYRFADVQSGQTVVMAVTAKRYTFATQVVSVADELTALNFVAQE